MSCHDGLHGTNGTSFLDILGLQRLLRWLVGRFIAYLLISKSTYRLLLL